MAVTVYRSTDAGAPALNGLAGSLITVLDAVLVNGYGSKPAAGWTKPFSGTNKAVYRNTAGTGRYFQFRDDSPTGAGQAHFAIFAGYESMTDVDTGAGRWPGITQTPLGVRVAKSTTNNNATVSSWMMIADEKCAYLFINRAITNNPHKGFPYSFGDTISYRPADAFCAHVSGYSGTGSYSPIYFAIGAVASHTITDQAANTTPSAIMLNRDHLGTPPTDSNCKNHGVYSVSAANGITSGSVSISRGYPDAVTNGLMVQPFILAGAGVIRGELYGLLFLSNARPFADQDTIVINGRTYLAVTIDEVASVGGQILVDISGPW